MKTVAVIGAGITGITTAYQLHKRGFNVVVYDEQSSPANLTSYANGGQVSACNSIVFNNWSNIFKGLLWMWRKDAPFRIGKLSIDNMRWIASFVCNTVNAKQNSIDTVKDAMRSHVLFKEMLIDCEIEGNYFTSGIYNVYKTKKAFKRAKKNSALLQLNGLRQLVPQPGEFKSIDKQLPSDTIGGIYTPGDAVADCNHICYEVADWLYWSDEVDFVYDTSVKKLAKSANGVMVFTADRLKEFDAVVVCAGVGSRELTEGLDDTIKSIPVKGHSITVYLDDMVSIQSAPYIGILDDEAKIVCSRLDDNKLRVAGFMELVGEDYNIDPNRINQLIAWVNKYYPDVSTDNVVPWCGLRPMMPNMRPVVQRGAIESIYYCTAPGHLGLTLSSDMADRIATMIAGDLNDRIT